MKTARTFIALALLCVIAYAGHKYTLQMREHKAQARPQARLLLALQETNTGVFEVDPTSQRITYANDAACRIFDYRGGTMTGEPLEAVLPESIRTSHRLRMEALAERFKQGSRVTNVITVRCGGVTRTGEQIQVMVRVFAGRDSGLFALVNRADESVYIDAMPKTDMAPADLKTDPLPYDPTAGELKTVPLPYVPGSGALK